MSATQSDPYQKCLDLAEKIINSLNDQNIISRYFERKDKIIERCRNQSNGDLSPRFDTDRAYQSYQKFVKDNRNLKEQLAQLQNQKPNYDNSPDNLSIAQAIHELRVKILGSNTKVPQKAITSATEELDVLQKAVDAKLDALAFMRDNLKKENNKLKSELADTTNDLNKRLIAAREKEQQDMLELSAADRQLDEELDRAQKEYAELQEHLENARIENEQLVTQHNEAAALLRQMEEDKQNAEYAIENMEAESEDLFREIERLKAQLSIKQRELESLQQLGKYGVSAGRGFDINEEVTRLRKRANALRSDNAQMAFELKRMERKTSIVDKGFNTSIDEDELAAKILRSKWH